MNILIQALLLIAVLLLLMILFFVNKYYIKTRSLMRYYENQGINNSYYFPLVGKYKRMLDSIKEHGDCMHYYKQLLTNQPDCKYTVTNLAHNVCIYFYDLELLNQLYKCSDLVKHQFGVEIFKQVMAGLVFNEGEEHSRKRKILSQAFHYQLLQNMIPQLSQIYEEFFEKIRNKRVSDCIMMGQEIVAESIVRLFFSNSFQGLKFKGKTMTEAVSGIIERVGSMAKSASYALFGKICFSFGQMASVKKDLKQIKEIYKEIITNRINSTNLEELQHKKQKDLIDYLIESKGISKIESEESITIDQIIEEFVTFQVAGLDSSGHTLGMVLYYLCIFPECKQKLVEEIEQTIKTPDDLNTESIKKMKYLGAFVNEVLRYYSVADQIFPRTCNKDIQIGDLIIKKGTQVNVGIIENHYNPKYFKDPHQFNPMRWLDGSLDKLNSYAFNPFSSGKHNCIGQHFAQLEIKVGIIKFLQEFDLELDQDYKFILKFSFLTEPLNPIPITFKSKKQ
ncbi:cytochrome P450 family monooxygenase (macronuclear) [Tetrahymena thermophila SB210]|uniref:Cytochrome P450 family monooxygenase n=1 Tax=Tetrahymena thermophila (strain SB210) TaxID=312017 RepID=I7MKL5_TETTS|nr:cytochrome P450 family monooxygenase [Tetrahymena thermophila SB210]EAR99512.2 cytochrome P450 family monooxygenase [Tetrahymena thermophila SB210]|eukprot:XP_001019757.2 cytochrome P450 family monooxygenase [Tetrahymena thermophila SB210]